MKNSNAKSYKKKLGMRSRKDLNGTNELNTVFHVEKPILSIII